MMSHVAQIVTSHLYQYFKSSFFLNFVISNVDFIGRYVLTLYNSLPIILVSTIWLCRIKLSFVK